MNKKNDMACVGFRSMCGTNVRKIGDKLENRDKRQAPEITHLPLRVSQLIERAAESTCILCSWKIWNFKVQF